MWKRIAVCLISVASSVGAQEAMTTVAFRPVSGERTSTARALSSAGNETNVVVVPKALQLGPGVRIIDADGETTFVPVIEAAGNLGDTDWAGGTVRGSIAFKLIPEPASGDAAEVADRIRIDTGTFAVNLGAAYSTFAKDSSDENGPIGVEIRLGAQIAYQRIPDSVDQESDEDADSGDEFAILTPELRVGAWLKYIYLGYKLGYNTTSANESDIASEIDESTTEKAVLIIPVLFESSSADQPMFIEASYTSSDGDDSEDQFAISLVKTFNVF